MMNEPTNGNGNGNGHKKIFTLAPAPDDDTRKILTARWRVNTHPRVADGAARLFTLLLDGSLNPDLNFGRRGVISVSQSVLGEWLNCGERSLRTYVKQLVTIGELWTRYKSLPHGAKILEYFLTCVRPQDEFEFTRGITDQQLWGRANGRTGFQNTARGDKGRFVSPGEPTYRQNLPVAPASAESAETPINAGSHGNGLPSATAKFFRGRRQNLPPTAAKNDRGRRQKKPGSGGNGLPSSAANSFRGRRQNPPDLIETETPNETKRGAGEGSKAVPPPVESEETTLTTWKARLPKMFPRELEKLLADLRTQKRQSKSPAAQHSLAARIAAVCEALYGAAPEETPATPAKPVKTTVTVTRKPLEGVALLESARAALRAGVITNGQREALLHCKSGISPADFALLKSCRIIGVEQVLEPVPV